MPRIADWLLDCIVYLYPTTAAAEAGEPGGGTGFTVSYPARVDPQYGYLYCVTNKHVIQDAKSPVISLNTNDGGKVIVELTEDDWTYHQAGDDLAAVHLVASSWENYKIREIRTELFVTKDFIQQQDIGPGEEVFMVGRLVNHEGRERNTPVVRFGNISMMPAPVRNQWGIDQESFLVEARSLSGFSGSPVFVYHTPTTPRPQDHPASEHGIWLLGVDWGHLYTYEKVREKKQENPWEPVRWEEISEGWEVRSNSGQVGVVPAWKLQELLDQEELAMARKKLDEDLAKRIEASSATFDAQAADESEQQPPFGRDDFFRDLKKAARKQYRPSQPDEEKR